MSQVVWDRCNQTAEWTLLAIPPGETAANQPYGTLLLLRKAYEQRTLRCDPFDWIDSDHVDSSQNPDVKPRHRRPSCELDGSVPAICVPLFAQRLGSLLSIRNSQLLKDSLDFGQLVP
jgi:hypothetical protein